jgi:hypothetical protein
MNRLTLLAAIFLAAPLLQGAMNPAAAAVLSCTGPDIGATSDGLPYDPLTAKQTVSCTVEQECVVNGSVTEERVWGVKTDATMKACKALYDECVKTTNKGDGIPCGNGPLEKY